ncbi:uncharacterized protein LOC144654706 isoform X2 [Oculina patagonica]
MRSSFSITLLIFGVCLLDFYVSTEICSGKEYTVEDADGKFLKCQPCDKCHEGYGLQPKCGSTVQSPVNNTDCKPCRSGTFSIKYDSSPCYQCQRCAKHEIVTSNCSSQSNTNCSGTCDSGYYFAKDSSHACHECSYCCSDEKDEVQPECVRQGLEARNQHCSRRGDKNCSPEQSTKKTTDNPEKEDKSLAITLGVLGGVLLVAIFIICEILRRKRRSRSDEGQIREQAREHETPMIKVVGDAKDATTSTLQENGNVANGQDAAALLNSSPSGPAVNPCIAKLNPGYDQSNPGTPRVSPNVTPHHTDDELDAVSDPPNVNRHRVKRQRSRGQIKIVQQPKSQKRTEGSRVEFTCKCNVQEKYEVCYQWFKDGTELQERNTCSLVLDPVRMRDSGCYSCLVTRVEDENENITSDRAVLEVVPRGGMRFKYLREVDLNIRDDIAILLQKKSCGTGGCWEMADKYGMEEHKITGLDIKIDPGRWFLEFLLATNPDLTVYSFCKKLKEDNMKRFDIVKVLEGHLSIKKEST